MRDLAVTVLTQQGHEVRVSDLYGMKFDPVAGPRDVLERINPDRFDLLAERREAFKLKKAGGGQISYDSDYIDVPEPANPPPPEPTSELIHPPGKRSLHVGHDVRFPGFHLDGHTFAVKIRPASQSTSVCQPA